jgi:hypothetical protein
MKKMGMTYIKNILCIVLTVGFFLFHPLVSYAGLFDKLGDAVKTMSQKAEQLKDSSSQENGDPDHPLNLTGEGHCKGQNTATCLDYMEVANQCLEPLKGHRMKLLADRIEHNLKTEKLSAQQRKNLEEDMAAAREAEKNHSDQPTIAGQKELPALPLGHFR